jgi:uncharacterized surface protein with fasciclin (FAS1) repeats
MKITINNWVKSRALLIGAVSFLASCNKELPDAVPNPVPSHEGASMMELLNDPNFSLLKTAVNRAVPASSSGLVPLNTLLADKTGEFTFYAPTNTAFAASGLTSAHINGMSTGLLDTLLRYHLVGGQKFLYTSASTPTPFPNFQFPSQLVLAPASASLPPGLRMPIFPSKSNGMWVNNIPVVQPDQIAANGVMHKPAVVVAPPTQFLWNRIDTAADLTYLRAAIKRADEGVAAASTLEAALKNPAANLTVFAPTDAAFKQALAAQITVVLMGQGMDQATATATATALAATPALFANPAVASVLTPETVKGIVVYHMFGNRAFTVNLPTTVTNKPTLLNTAIATHPGVAIQATFGATGVTAATVKGAANTTAANILINPTPSSMQPAGTSDQHYINGVLHKIDQVLRPQ